MKTRYLHSPTTANLANAIHVAPKKGDYAVSREAGCAGTSGVIPSVVRRLPTSIASDWA
jgi:hypothetical protein